MLASSATGTRIAPGAGGKVPDVNVLDLIEWLSESIVVIDRDHLDFDRPHRLLPKLSG